MAVGLILCTAVLGEVAAEEIGAGAAACRTFDRAERPSTLFAPGDEILVTVDRVEPYALGRIDVVQGGDRTRLTSALADEAGHLSTDWREAKLPPEVVPGAARLEVVTAASRVTCGIQVLDTNVAVAASKQRRTPYVTMWAFALLFFGSFLSLASFRRWRATRLAALVGPPSFASADRVVPIVPTFRAVATPDEDPSDADELIWDEPEEPEGAGPELAGEVEALDDLEDLDVDGETRDAADGQEDPDDVDDDLDAMTSETVARLLREARAWRDRKAVPREHAGSLL